MTLLALIPKNKIMFLITMDNLPVIHSPSEHRRLSAATRSNLSLCKGGWREGRRRCERKEKKTRSEREKGHMTDVLKVSGRGERAA